MAFSAAALQKRELTPFAFQTGGFSRGLIGLIPMRLQYTRGGFRLITNLLGQPTVDAFPCKLSDRAPTSHKTGRTVAAPRGLRVGFIVNQLNPCQSFDDVVNHFRGIALTNQALTQCAGRSRRSVQQSQCGFPACVKIIWILCGSRIAVPDTPSVSRVSWRFRRICASSEQTGTVRFRSTVPPLNVRAFWKLSEERARPPVSADAG